MKAVKITEFRDIVAESGSVYIHIRNPLSPIDMTMRFDRAYVNTSASPYVCLSNEYSQVTISHIKSIHRKKEENVGIVFSLLCLDYANPHDPTEITLDLECVKKL